MREHNDLAASAAQTASLAGPGERAPRSAAGQPQDSSPGLCSTELAQLLEGKELEAKRAAGRDGRGELPASFFESYSAFANTDGGIILLGVDEDAQGALQVAGIAEPQRVLKMLWDGLNNRQRVSANLLRDEDVTVVELAGRAIVRVAVPRAQRRARPVYVGTNPLTGTFRRNHEGDYRCPEEVVRRMLAEQLDDTRDARVLPRHGLADLDAATLARYRQRYQARVPDHPWNGLDNREFLRSIGGWARDREAGIEGLTAAGLLMFGKLVEIKEVFPYYMLDYQERVEPRAEARWVDRVTTDLCPSGSS